MTLEIKTKVKDNHTMRYAPQSIDHIAVVFSIIDCASFFVSSCFISPELKT